MTRPVRFLLTCLLVVGVTTSVAADHWQHPVERLARAYGCQAEVVTNDRISVIGSFYDWLGDVLYVGTSDDDNVPDYVFVIVALHEIAHCLQDQADRIRGRESIQVELEADMLAAEMACQAGLDGRRMLHDTFVWAKETFDYEGDPNHGTLVQRIRAGYYAPSCGNNKRGEAPVAG